MGNTRISVLECIVALSGCSEDISKLSDLDSYQKRYIAGKMKESKVHADDAPLAEWNQVLWALGQRPCGTQEQAYVALMKCLEGGN